MKIVKILFYTACGAAVVWGIYKVVKLQQLKNETRVLLAKK